MNDGLSPDETESRAAQIQALVARYETNRAASPVPAWILPPASCEFLRDIAALFPSSPAAFEFGSGQSTGVLRGVSSQTMTIEHSSEWLRQTEKDGASKRPDDQSVVLPLRPCWNRLRIIESFDVEANPRVIEALQQANLILVDSPPNPAKREHALFVALRHAPVGAVIVLDDLEVRAVDRFTLRLARQNAGAFRFWKVNMDHQLGVFLKIRSELVRSLPTLREFVGTWLRA